MILHVLYGDGREPVGRLVDEEANCCRECAKAYRVQVEAEAYRAALGRAADPGSY